MRHVILWLVTHGSILCFFFSFASPFLSLFLLYLSYVICTYVGRDSCPPAQNHSRHSWVHVIDHGVLPYYSPSAIS